MNLDSSRRFYEKGMGMTVIDPIKTTKKAKKTHRQQKVYENALLKKVTVIQKLMLFDSQELGKGQVMTMLAPNGFLIEIFQKLL